MYFVISHFNRDRDTDGLADDTQGHVWKLNYRPARGKSVINVCTCVAKGMRRDVDTMSLGFSG